MPRVSKTMSLRQKRRVMKFVKLIDNVQFREVEKPLSFDPYGPVRAFRNMPQNKRCSAESKRCCVLQLLYASVYKTGLGLNL